MNINQVKSARNFEINTEINKKLGGVFDGPQPLLKDFTGTMPISKLLINLLNEIRDFEPFVMEALNYFLRMRTEISF